MIPTLFLFLISISLKDILALFFSFPHFNTSMYSRKSWNVLAKASSIGTATYYDRDRILVYQSLCFGTCMKLWEKSELHTHEQLLTNFLYRLRTGLQIEYSCRSDLLCTIVNLFMFFQLMKYNKWKIYLKSH